MKIYSEIAAGKPIYMNEEIKGDSMIDAGIDNGDYVVIHKQNVAVAIEENATLKRWMKMGDTVLLIPENEKYEPIQIKGEQASIIGIAVGIIK